MNSIKPYKTLTYNTRVKSRKKFVIYIRSNLYLSPVFYFHRGINIAGKDCNDSTDVVKILKSYLFTSKTIELM